MTELPRIPFNDLARATSEQRHEIDEAVDRVLTSGWFVLGPEHDAFESELAAYVGVSHAIGVANGTDALELALAVAGVGPGDTVLTVANAGGYSSVAARLRGAAPVYADVSPETLQMTVETARAALDGLPDIPRVMIVTHLYGAMAPVRELRDLADQLGIILIEDCAQSIGASRDGRRAGSFGHLSTASFYPTKNLGALGDGGAVLTDDPGLASGLRSLRQYGWDGKYRIGRGGGRNSRLDEMQAAILRVRLPRLDAQNERRRRIHARYEQASSEVFRLVNSGSESFIAHLAVAVVQDRDAAREVLGAAGIGTDVHYPIPDHRQPFPGGDAISLPATEAAAGSVLSLPMFPELRDDEVDRVCETLATIGGDA